MKEMPKRAHEIHWKVFPPFIDAYETSPYTEGDGKDVSKAFENFKKALKSNASTWGAAGIGEQVIREGGNTTIDCSNKLKHILSVGYFYTLRKSSEKRMGKTSFEGHYAVVSPSTNPYDKEAEIVEFDYPDEWDVT